ncbi:MAG: hypothetical protein HC845_10635 [Akkermansiaceae bacterium]|nr:hypothetical protein [Akkermansiaceae bacterium]
MNEGRKANVAKEVPAARIKTSTPIAVPASDKSESAPASAPDSTPISPPPRSEASRAPSKRDFSDPLGSAPSEAAPARSFNPPSGEQEPVFQAIQQMFSRYRTITGENPVGTNAEMMKAIMGGNPKSAMLGPPEGQTVSGDGELLDEWGAPYFFHQLTKDVIEIHSAGPDRKLWTGDDVLSR